MIVFATLQQGTLRWLAHEGGRFTREDGAAVLQGSLDPALSFAIHGRATIVGARRPRP